MIDKLIKGGNEKALKSDFILLNYIQFELNDRILDVCKSDVKFNENKNEALKKMQTMRACNNLDNAANMR